MTKVKALRSFTAPGGAPVKPGAVVDLDNGLAQNLILRGRAELVKPTPPGIPAPAAPASDSEQAPEHQPAQPSAKPKK